MFQVGQHGDAHCGVIHPTDAIELMSGDRDGHSSTRMPLSSRKLQKPHCCSCGMRSGIVQLEDGDWILHHWHHMVGQDFLDVASSIEVSLNPDQFCSVSHGYGSPHHDTSSFSMVVSFSDAAPCITLSGPPVCPRSSSWRLSRKLDSSLNQTRLHR